MITQIVNGEILGTNEWIKNGSLIIEDDKILEVISTNLPIANAKIIDAAGKYVIPGFVAMNIHGGDGANFKEATKEAFLKATRAHLKYGATTIFPTISTSPNEVILDSIKVCEELMTNPETPIMGLHLEGPYISERMSKGLYSPRPIDRDEYKAILKSTNCIKRWDASPNLPGAHDFARTLKKYGVVTAITHTEAEYEDIRAAYIAGYTHAAQFYNSMPGFHKKNEYKYEGTVESVYLIKDMTVEVIADGKHLPATILKLVYKLKGVEKTALVTDALAYAAYSGEINTKYNIIIDDGVCKTQDKSSLAGSIATSDMLIRTMVNKADIPLRDAIRMATETPAKIMKVYDKVGSLEKGKLANIVLLNKDLTISNVYLKGKIVE